jgi:hypothetical protein
MARLEPNPAAGLSSADPDRIAALLAQRAYAPSVSVVVFEDYLTRELIVQTVEAELQHVHQLTVATRDLASAQDLQAFLAERPGGDGLAFLLGVEKLVDEMGATLNASRDKLAERRVVLWLSKEGYSKLAADAPDLVSYVGPIEEPVVGGALAPARVLEPKLDALEEKWGMSTAEFLAKLRSGAPTGVPDVESHEWAGLARVLQRSGDEPG